MQDLNTTTRLAVALRLGRTALGLSQEEFAQLLGIARTTVARAETLDGGLRVDQIVHILQLLRSKGVYVDFMYEDEVKITVSSRAIDAIKLKLLDEELRRTDRRKPVGSGPLNFGLEQPENTGTVTGLLGNPAQFHGLLSGHPTYTGGLLGTANPPEPTTNPYPKRGRGRPRKEK